MQIADQLSAQMIEITNLIRQESKKLEKIFQELNINSKDIPHLSGKDKPDLGDNFETQKLLAESTEQIKLLNEKIHLSKSQKTLDDIDHRLMKIENSLKLSPNKDLINGYFTYKMIWINRSNKLKDEKILDVNKDKVLINRQYFHYL
jgi:hypothetical protein